MHWGFDDSSPKKPVSTPGSFERIFLAGCRRTLHSRCNSPSTAIESPIRSPGQAGVALMGEGDLYNAVRQPPVKGETEREADQEPALLCAHASRKRSVKAIETECIQSRDARSFVF